MDILFLVAIAAALVWYIRNDVFWVFLWQKKEYRLDRLFIHLVETKSGRNLLFSPISFLKWFGIGFYFFTVFNDSYIPLFHIFIIALYLIEALLVVREVVLSQLQYPIFTPKAIFLIVFSLFSMLVLLSIPLLDKFFWLLLLDRLLFLSVGFFVFLFSFPTELHRDLLIKRAIKKIATHGDIMVIGITGSYGKSSTKEFIARILSKKFSVVKTEGNGHTLSAIADVILSKVNKKTQILVAEMGAYGRGEIAAMCYVLKPNIGIITGINDQHMSLFRSLKNSIDAKNELIESLPKKGLALFNGDDKEALKLYKKAKIQKVKYGMQLTDDNGSQIIAASNIHVEKNGVTFTVHIKKKRFTLQAPLLGSHNITNLLPAIYIADYFGMTQREIKQIISNLRPLKNTMVRVVNKKGVVVVDDSFNDNPESIASALSYSTVYEKKRYFVLQPMLELGRNAKEHHYKAGKEIAGVCNTLLLTNKNYIKEIQRGIVDSKKNCKLIYGRPKKLAKYLTKNAKRGDVVICEGYEARGVVDQLVS